MEERAMAVVQGHSLCAIPRTLPAQVLHLLPLLLSPRSLTLTRLPFLLCLNLPL